MIKHWYFAPVNCPLPGGASFSVRLQSSRLRRAPNRAFVVMQPVLLVDRKRGGARHKGPIYLGSRRSKARWPTGCIGSITVLDDVTAKRSNLI